MDCLLLILEVDGVEGYWVSRLPHLSRHLTSSVTRNLITRYNQNLNYTPSLSSIHLLQHKDRDIYIKATSSINHDHEGSSSTMANEGHSTLPSKPQSKYGLVT